jgi:hypothetical protein
MIRDSSAPNCKTRIINGAPGGPLCLPGIRTHNRLIRRSGIPPVIVAGMLGHSLSILMTTYAHFIPGSQDEAARVMDDILSPIPIQLKELE